MWNCSFSQNYTNYTISDGLPSNHVYTIRQDAKGFIWFLTDKGMVKYNGSEFKSFTTKEGLPNNDVWEAFVTSDDKVWYLSKAAQLGYISNDSVYAFPNEVTNEIINPIFSYKVEDKVFLSGSVKTHQLIDEEWKVINNNRGRLKIHHPKVKSLSLNKLSNMLYVYDENDLIMAEFEAKDFILNAKRGHLSGNLYYIINSKGYYILNLNTLELYSRSFKGQLGYEEVKHARINKVNDELQITGEGFVGFLDEQFNIKRPFLFPKEINAHFGLIDKSKNIWCATFHKGVIKIPYNKKDAAYSFLGQKVQALDVINNELYVSVYDDGFYRYNSENVSYESKLKLKGYKYSAQYIEALNAIYYLSHGNAYSEINGKPSLRYDYTTTNSNNKDKARKLIYHNNQLYGLFAFGLYHIDEETFDIKNEFPQKGTNDVLSHDGKLFIATTNGLKVFENDEFVSKNYNVLLNKSVLNLEQLSNSQFLINTDGFGSYIATNSELQPLKGTGYLSVQGAFVEDNAIWLATNEGVLHYDIVEGDYVLKSKITTKNGLPIDNVNAVAVLDDTLFVATDNGLVSIPKKMSYKPQFLDVYIDEVYYDSNKLYDKTTIPYTSNNTLNVTIKSIDFSEQPSSVFDYKLLPNHKDWKTALTSTVNFNDLQPNDYEFVVSKNGIEKSFTFTIKPLWWQTLGFRISITFIIAALLLSGVWLLSKRIQKRKDLKLIQEKQLSEIQLKALRSQMNPHFVFNSLAAIQYYINDNDYEASERYLVKFSKLIRQFFELSKENEITLKEEIKLLNNYLEIEKLRFREKLDFQIKVDEKLNLNQTKIPTMLLQSIVENAVNHGVFNKMDNGKVTLDFQYKDENTFIVNVSDDGVGFENTNSKPKQHTSSNVIADRLKFLNQTRNWKITFENKELNSEKEDKGNQAIFTIMKLN